MTSPHHAIHRERWEGFARNFGASVAARAISVTCTLAQVPFALKHLGPEAYGFWMILTGALTLLNISDLGLGISLQNRMAAHFGRGETAAISGLLRHGLRMLALTAGLATLVLVPVVLALDWARVFNLTDPGVIGQVRACLLLTVAGFCLNLPLTLAVRLAAAVQRSWLTPFWNCAGILFQLAAVIAASLLQAGVVVFVGVYLGMVLLQNLAILLHLRRTLPWLRDAGLPPAAADRHHLRRAAYQLFIPQACGAFSFAFLPAAIAMFSSPGVVTQFNLLQRLFGVLLQAQWTVTGPLWPAYAEAQARRDAGWIRKSFRVSQLFALLLFGALVVIGATHHWLLHLWLGDGAPAIDPTLLVLTAAWFGGMIVTHPFGSLLGGLGHAGGMGLYWLATCAIFVTGAFWLGPAHGAPAVMGSAALAMLAVNLPGMVIEALVRYRRTVATLDSAPADVR